MYPCFGAFSAALRDRGGFSMWRMTEWMGRCAAALGFAYLASYQAISYAIDDAELDIVDKLIPQIGLGDSLASPETQEHLTESVTRFRSLASILVGLSAMTCVFFLALSIVKLGRSGDNDNERRRATGGIAAASIALALLGGITVYLGLLWGLLR